MATFSPVFGLRPSFARRVRTVKLPNPRISIFSPRWRASFMLWNTVSTMTSHSFLVRLFSDSDSFSTRSLFVIPVVPPKGLLGKKIQPQMISGNLLVDQGAHLLTEQFEEGDLLLREGHDLRLAGDLPELPRVGNRVLEIPEDVDQAQPPGLLPGEDPPVGDPEDIFPVEIPAGRHGVDELQVDVVDHPLE